MARLILGLVYAAQQVLKIEELQHAIRTLALVTKRKDEKYMWDEEDILACTMGFLNLGDSEAVDGREVCWDHQTVQESFAKLQRQPEKGGKTAAEAFLGISRHFAQACLTRLKFKDFEAPCSLDPARFGGPKAG